MKPAVGKPASAGDFLLERRARLVRDRLPARRGVLLDYGCGNGAQTAFFLHDFSQVHGVDVTRASLDDFAASARNRLESGALQLHVTDGRTIPLPDDSVDCIVSFEVLEHVDDEAAVLAELRRVLAPGGRLVMTVPNRWWIFETHGADLPLLPWNRVPFFSWLPAALHDRWARARIYSRGRIVRLLEASGFSVGESLHVTAPMDVVPWNGLRSALRSSLFRADRSRCPFLATSVMVVAEPLSRQPISPAPPSR